MNKLMDYVVMGATILCVAMLLLVAFFAIPVIIVLAVIGKVAEPAIVWLFEKLERGLSWKNT